MFSINIFFMRAHCLLVTFASVVYLMFTCIFLQDCNFFLSDQNNSMSGQNEVCLDKLTNQYINVIFSTGNMSYKLLK